MHHEELQGCREGDVSGGVWGVQGVCGGELLLPPFSFARELGENRGFENTWREMGADSC